MINILGKFHLMGEIKYKTCLKLVAGLLHMFLTSSEKPMNICVKNKYPEIHVAWISKTCLNILLMPEVPERWFSRPTTDDRYYLIIVIRFEYNFYDCRNAPFYTFRSLKLNIIQI